MRSVFLLYLLIALLCSGCDLKAREEALQKKEVELTQREQQLSLREKLVAIREEEVLQLKQKLDSAQTKLDSAETGNNTSLIYNAQLIGPWNVKMTCTETTCPGSAVGDTKAETWEISYQNNLIIAKANAGDKLVRIYTGSYNGTNLVLSENVANSSSEPATRLSIRLTLTNDNTMEGQREIVRENDCRIVYSLQLDKQQSSTK
jgi:hypothetical protein